LFIAVTSCRWQRNRFDSDATGSNGYNVVVETPNIVGVAAGNADFSTLGNGS
jgi:hypothetical protein